MSSTEEISTEHQDEFVNWPKTRQLSHLASVNHRGSLTLADERALSPAARVRHHDRMHALQERDRYDNPPDDPAGLLQIFPHGYVEAGGERIALLPDGSLERPIAVNGGEILVVAYPPASSVLGPVNRHAPLAFTEGTAVDNADIQVTASGVARCGSEIVTWDERPIRCEKAAGHLKKHGFRIKWEDADV